MGQDTDIARVVAVLRTPGIRYRSFGNQPVRDSSSLDQAASPAVSPLGANPAFGSAPATGSLTIAPVSRVENLLEKQPAMEILSLASPKGEGLARQHASMPARAASRQPDGQAVAAGLKGTVSLAAGPAPSACHPPADAPAADIPPALGGAAALLAALHAAEARHTAMEAAPLVPTQRLPMPPAAPPGSPPLLKMLAPEQHAPSAPPPLLAALAAPLPPMLKPSAGHPVTAAAPAALGDILRSLGQPPAAPAPAEPAEKAVPEVLRALRLTGLG